MRTLYTLILSTFCIVATTAQQDQVITFENQISELDTFLNGSDGVGSFGDMWWVLPNDYNEDFMSWTGWAISTKTDTETPGFNNQYSAITGSGVDGSQAYAVSYHFVPNTMMVNPDAVDAAPILTGAYITNATYPYLSMRDGDAFAKKFGGASGDDPDFFLLTAYGYNFSGEVTDSVEFYLADYRFEDNSQDYIVDEWTWVDLSALGFVQRVEFVLTSTDVGMFGVNTPTYFCIDNITYDLVTSTDNELTDQVSVYPNPATDMLTVEHPGTASTIHIYDTAGRLLQLNVATGESTDVQVSDLPSGSYLLMVRGSEGSYVQRFVRL